MLATIAAVLGIFYAVLFLIAGSIICSLIADNEDFFNCVAAAPGIRHLSSAVDYLRSRREDHREPATA